MTKIVLFLCLLSVGVSGFSRAEDYIIQPCVVPKLVPFNQVLFNSYCEYKAQECENTRRSAFKSRIIGIVLTYVGMSSLFAANDKIGASWNACADASGLGALVWHGGALTLATGAGLYALGNLINSINMLCVGVQVLSDNDYDEQEDEWNSLICTSRDEQERLWHQIIYEKLGKPIVHGSYQDGVLYTLKFDKKYGVGCVLLDPYNSEDMRILLGIDLSIKDNCMCDELYIVIQDEGFHESI